MLVATKQEVAILRVPTLMPSLTRKMTFRASPWRLMSDTSVRDCPLAEEAIPPVPSARVERVPVLRKSRREGSPDEEVDRRS